MIAIPFAAWLVMLLVGAAHSGAAQIPALGYWVTLALTAAAWIVIALCSSE